MRDSGRVFKGALLMTGLTVGTIIGLGGPRADAAPALESAGVDTSVVAALERMGAFLRDQPHLAVDSDVTTDDVLPSGQKVEYGGTVHLRARRPDRLRVEIVTDRRNEQMLYDGRTFTVFQPQTGYYASFSAPPTLRDLVDVMEKRYGIDLPLADLFRLGTDRAQLAAIRRATALGKSSIKGTVCSHYAFHETDVDWEIWIEDGPQPLPRKLVITTLTDKTQPQYTSVMTWNLAPKLEEQSFVFTPPPDSHPIGFDAASLAPAAPRPTPTATPTATPIPGGTP